MENIDIIEEKTIPPPDGIGFTWELLLLGLSKANFFSIGIIYK